MGTLDTVKIDCPYCGEITEILIDCSVEDQKYIEDCFVCCRPIVLHITIDKSGIIAVSSQHENEC